jgi:hypothetical protein
MHLTDQSRRERAVSASIRLLAGGGRPVFHVQSHNDGRRWIYSIDELPGVFGEAAERDNVVDGARAMIAVWLNVDPDRFDVAVGEQA